MFPLKTILQSLSFLKIHTVMFMYQCRHLQQSNCECTRNRRHTQVLALIKFCESKLRFWVTLRSPVNKYWELFLLFLSFEPMFVVKRPIRELFAHMEMASLMVKACKMMAKIWPMFGLLRPLSCKNCCDTGRRFYMLWHWASVLHVVTGGLGFCGFVQSTALSKSPFKASKGY